jgi:hypothetical protein
MSARRSFGRDDGGSARMRPAKPNLNARVNHLIEQALGPRSADWNEHFDRPSSGRKFHYKPGNGMAPLRGDAPNRIRHVLVEQEGHAPASAIWRAIR